MTREIKKSLPVKPAPKVSEKNKSAMDNYDIDALSDPFIVPEAVKKELEAQGLVCRWISEQHLKDFGGVHRSGWIPYMRPKDAELTTYEKLFGKDSSGFVKKGNLILGVKTKEDAARHKRYLKEEAKRMSAENQKNKDNVIQDLMKMRS